MVLVTMVMVVMSWLLCGDSFSYSGCDCNFLLQLSSSMPVHLYLGGLL